MKKITLVLSVIALFTSCSNWLDVAPFDSLEKDKIYNSERSANSALNGIYLMLADNSLYAKELSVGFVDVLAQNFTVPTTSGNYEHDYYQFSQYEYNKDRPKAILEKVFIKAYQAIANCNEFLESVEKSKSVFSTATYNLYMGEAIAIRTLLHFDMLRVFGPVPADFVKESVPYYNLSTDVPQPILTADALLDILIADMDKAIAYLKDDPILTEGLNGDLENVNDTDFFRSFRNMHMNYYAANAVKARMCLYKGTDESKAAAYTIASRLLEGKDPANQGSSVNFKSVFSFPQNRTTQGSFTIFYPEILFGIHNTRRPEVHKDLFSADLPSDKLMAGGEKFWDRLYTTGVAGNDGLGTGLRRNMWTYDGIRGVYLFTRLSPDYTEKSHPYHHQFQCIMRIGELYLIAAETAPDTETKRSWIEKMRVGKGYDPGNADSLSDAQLDEVMEFEFRKDTYGEGQYFFFAKRRARTNVINQANTTTSMTAGRYVLPLPAAETDYRTK